jgi:hypothetical protein
VVAASKTDQFIEQDGHRDARSSLTVETWQDEKGREDRKRKETAREWLLAGSDITIHKEPDDPKEHNVHQANFPSCSDRTH